MINIEGKYSLHCIKCIVAKCIQIKLPEGVDIEEANDENTLVRIVDKPADIAFINDGMMLARCTGEGEDEAVYRPALAIVLDDGSLINMAQVADWFDRSNGLVDSEPVEGCIFKLNGNDFRSPEECDPV